VAKGKSKKATPAELDFLFSRKIIDEGEYRDFWSNYWKASNSEREEIVSGYLEDKAEETEEDEENIPLSGIVTTNRSLATDQANRIGGVVRRRNRFGQFSKRGRFYQAIRTRRKK
jgi:hypothetical protein